MIERLNSVLHQTHAGARRIAGVVTRSWRRAVREERILATATFALIFATTVSCLDALVTGAGPDWNPGGEAYAMEVESRTVEPVRAAPLSLAPIVLETASVQADYSFTTEVLLGGPDAVEPAPRSGKPMFATAQAVTVGKTEAHNPL